jgi:hypothetical protein
LATNLVLIGISVSSYFLIPVRATSWSTVFYELQKCGKIS